MLSLLTNIESLQRALDLDLEYVQLQHMCLVSQLTRLSYCQLIE
jgi:hypothetical protein